MAERVAITGAGAITPIGCGYEAFRDGLRAGCSAVKRITAFDASGLPTRIAAEIRDEADDLTRWVEPRKATKLMSRAALFGVAAAAMARKHAGLDRGAVDPCRLAVVMGAGGMGPTDLDLLATQAGAVIDAAQAGGSGGWDIPTFARLFAERTNPVATLRGLPNLAAAHVAIQNDARGPNATITTACCAGTQAIGEGLRLIQRGDADVVLAGGTDAGVNPVAVLGFSLLGTLSRRNEEPGRASRPFDRARDGFVIGEGAGAVVLERQTFAEARGARVLAELAGYGVSCDAYRITDERPDAEGAARAIGLTLSDAELAPAEVEYVNAHGTGTPMNDITETRALKLSLKAHAGKVPISSTKSMIGHLLAAAGAVELVAAVIAIREGFIPPTINLDVADDECDLDYVPNVARTAAPATALSTSFGFGGQNACLAIRRW
ncbi:MAG TPA: beta-ketoacyl-[acyl-carrier-protein] synthase family protein [Gemmatimonadales bacterium]